MKTWTVLTSVVNEATVEATDLQAAVDAARAAHPGGEVIGVIEVSPLTEHPPPVVKRRGGPGRPRGSKNKPKGPTDSAPLRLQGAVPSVRARPEARRTRRPRNGMLRECECGNPPARPDGRGESDYRCTRCIELEGQAAANARSYQADQRRLRQRDPSLGADTQNYNPSPPPWPQFDSREVENPRLARWIRRLSRPD